MSRVKDKRMKIKALQCLLVAGLLVLFCSCLSFNIGDWPSKFVYPNNKPTANWCGPVGALFAYYLLYYVGPGVFIVLISGMYFAVAKVAEIEIEQPILRGAGLVLVTTAASTTFYCFTPHGIYGFPTGSGGVLGCRHRGISAEPFRLSWHSHTAWRHLGCRDDFAGRPDCGGGFWRDWFYNSQDARFCGAEVADRVGAVEGSRSDMAPVQRQTEIQPAINIKTSPRCREGGRGQA